jgi:hypothetical protein
MTYPKDPGFVSGSETSEHAAREVESKASAMRNKIMRLVGMRGMFGCTRTDPQNTGELQGRCLCD